MRVLRECLYKSDFSGNVGNEYCGPVLSSVSHALQKFKKTRGNSYDSLMTTLRHTHSKNRLRAKAHKSISVAKKNGHWY
jgi:enolase